MNSLYYNVMLMNRLNSNREMLVGGQVEGGVPSAASTYINDGTPILHSQISQFYYFMQFSS